MLLNKHLFLYFSIFCCWIGNSQSEIQFEKLSGDNAPNQSITYSIKQDSVGVVWVGTEEGILKHNSKNFKVYNTYTGLPETLGNRVQALFIDNEENIWGGTERGVCIYNSAFDRFDLVKSKTGINPSLVKAFVQTQDGVIWVGGFNGLWKFNPKQNILIQVYDKLSVQTMAAYNNRLILGTTSGVFELDRTTKTPKIFLNTPLDASISFTCFEDSILFIGTKEGALFKADINTEVFTQTNFNSSKEYPITDVFKDASGNFYIATDGLGLFYTNQDFEILANYRDDNNNPSALSSNGIYDLLPGRQGILWIATYGGGVNYYDESKASFTKIRHQINDENSIVSNFTRAIAQDANGQIWFGTKRGLSIWNVESNTWKHIKTLNGQKAVNADIVLALEPDGNSMWVGTYNAGAYRVDINSLAVKAFNPKEQPAIQVARIYALFKDKDQTIWLGGIDGDLTRISASGAISSLPIKQIKYITQDIKGMLLAAGRNGIYKINPQTNEFSLIEALIPDRKKFAYTTVNAIDVTQSGDLYVATSGAGLLLYKNQTQKVIQLDVQSGIPSDIVQGVLSENDTDLWASTANGLAHIQMTTKDTVIHIFDSSDGLASTEFNYGSFARLDDGRFAFGGTEGVTFFDPKAIQDSDGTPNIVFNDFKIFNKSVTPGKAPLLKHINETQRIVLPYYDNSISLDFSGVKHSSSKVRYSWMLDGFEQVWSEPKEISNAVYTNLNPGLYVFKVRAANKFGEYGALRSITIEILPPWWATSAAYVLYAIIGLALLLITIYITKVLVTKRNAEEQIAFFNNITHEIKTPLTVLLTSLDSVTDDDRRSNKRIKATVSRINSLFEQMLNFHKVTSQHGVTENITKINLIKYFNRLQNDLNPLLEERNLKIVIYNNWGADLYYQDLEVFNKIVLNLTSNAIKYSFNGGTIKIKTQKLPQQVLQIKIIDEGIGIPQDQQKFILKRYYRARNVINSQRPGTGLGLIMVKKLIDKLGDTIAFESEENKGTTFILTLKSRKTLFDKQARLRAAFGEQESVVAVDPEVLNTFRGAKLLVVEDNNELRELLIEQLSAFFDVHQAINGTEGLRMAKELYPELILTDLIMPEMDGLEFAKAVKADINLNHIPVFMMTVLQSSKQKLESIESGVAEYIEKPINIDLLKAKILNALRWQKQLREKYVHQNDTETAQVFKNKNDQDFIKNLEEVVINNLEDGNFSVHDLAQEFGMSRTSLYMKLKNLVDLSPQDFIIHTKLQLAKQLLIKGDQSIKQVAYNSGFSNPKYFSTSFKKFYGMSPSKFISSLKENAK